MIGGRSSSSTDKQDQELTERCGISEPFEAQGEISDHPLPARVGAEVIFDGTVAGLILCYQTDGDSTYRKIRPHTRQFYNALCKRLVADFGNTKIKDVKARQILHWNEAISVNHVPMAHSLVSMLRTLCGFGTTLLEDDECARLSGVLGKMRFQTAKPRTEHLTAEQAVAVRAELRRMGHRSIALAQAFQFDCTFRQKDVIGEWVKRNETGISGVCSGGNKWLRGITWNEIDADWILTHVTSKRQKEVQIDLKLAAMVMEELGSANRADFPTSGPVIVRELTGVPWSATEFRKYWREAATAIGIPKEVRNMDSRSGAITEALRAGASLDSVRKSATHSNASMTTRYSRGDAEEIADVMKLRAASRTVA